MMLVRLVILDTKEKEKGRLCVDLRDEGYEILREVGSKAQNYPYFVDDVDPNVDENMMMDHEIRSMMLLQEQLKIFRWSKLVKLSLVGRQNRVKKRCVLIDMMRNKVIRIFDKVRKKVEIKVKEEIQKAEQETRKKKIKILIRNGKEYSRI
jgi:phosphosulfolactate synthase (CoM biosynthesis protein A)